MPVVETLRLVLQADTGAAVKGLENVGKAADRELARTDDKLLRTSKMLQKFGTGAMLVAGAVGVGLYKAGQAASDLEQAVGGTEAVFKDAAGTIEEASKKAADGAGLSERAFREATTSIGGNLKRMGYDVDTAAAKSIELTQTAADLAATYGGTTAEAVDALGAAFRGEADPAERFNLNLKIGAVNAKAVELGLAASTAKVSEHAKAQALLALITEQSADAQGQFARESDTAAGSMQRATANIENAKASIGQSMAPIMADVADAVSGLASGFGDLNEATGGAASKILTFGTIALGTAGTVATVAGKVMGAWGKITPLFDRAAVAAYDLSGNMGKLAKNGAAVAVAGFAVSELFSTWSKEMGKADDAASDMAASVVGSFDATKASAAEFEAQYAKLEAARKKFHDAGNDAVNPLLIEHHRKAAEALLEEQMAMKATGDQAAALMDELGLTADEALAFATDADRMAAATDNATGELDANAAAAEVLAAEVDAAAKAYDDLDDQLNARFDPLFGAQDAMNDLAEAQRDATEALKEHGPKSAEYLAASDKVVRAAQDNESAQYKLRAAIEAGKVKVEDAIDTLNRWAAEGKITQDQANWTALSFSALRDQANSIPREIRTTVILDGYQAVINQLNSINSRYSAEKVNVKSVGGTIPRFAIGGGIPGPKGKPVPIIAHGGEQVLSTDIVDAIKAGKPTAGLPALAGSPGGPGGTYHNYNITVHALDTQEAARAVVDAIETAKRNGMWR